MTRIPLFLFLLGCVPGAQADEPALRPSARLLFKDPELAKPGSCVMYQEGSTGLAFSDPVYWLKGTVTSAEIRSRKLERCPRVPGKLAEQYTREEFNRLAASTPCVGPEESVRQESVGLMRLRVEEWETPWTKRAANANRLYQGHFIDRPLQKGMELEVEADLLGGCS